MKYGLFKYETENIGDEIQSIAARRFLPTVDELIDRDRLGEYAPSEEIKLITNGWFMHPPYQWPPKSEMVKPLLISMYVDPSDPKVGDAFFSDEGIEYLNSHGPVGARDLSTLELLRKHGVDAYFSGCMTLTLQRDPDTPKGDFILAVDVPQPVVDMIRQHTDRAVIQSSPYFDANMSQTDRFQLAEYFLYLYQSAHAVISTRLHAMLPSLAMGTPVFLVKDHQKYDEKRYAGLADLVNSATDTEYLEDYSLFDVDNPKANPDTFLEIRERLISTVSKFTGYNNSSTFRTVDFSKIACNESYIRLFTKGFYSLNRALLLEGDKSWLQEQNDDLRRINDDLRKINDDLRKVHENQNAHIEELESIRKNLVTQNEELRKQIEEIKNSNTWKIGSIATAPGRRIKDLIKEGKK